MPNHIIFSVFDWPDLGSLPHADRVKPKCLWLTPSAGSLPASHFANNNGRPCFHTDYLGQSLLGCLGGISHTFRQCQLSWHLWNVWMISMCRIAATQTTSLTRMHSSCLRTWGIIQIGIINTSVQLWHWTPSWKVLGSNPNMQGVLKKKHTFTMRPFGLKHMTDKYKYIMNYAD